MTFWTETFHFMPKYFHDNGYFLKSCFTFWQISGLAQKMDLLIKKSVYDVCYNVVFHKQCPLGPHSTVFTKNFSENTRRFFFAETDPIFSYSPIIAPISPLKGLIGVGGRAAAFFVCVS